MRYSYIFSKIPSSIWGICAAVFLMNSSTIIVFGFCAVYMKINLGSSTALIGFVEGVIEAFACFLKLFSGVFSDFLGRRKPIMISGYAFCTMSRIVTTFSTTPFGIIGSRILSRIGNGLQATPRDAMIADLACHEIIGTSYGLRNACGMIGSSFGAIVGFFVMKWTNQNFGITFMVSTVLAIIATFCLILFVKEKPAYTSGKKIIHHPIHLKDIPRLGKYFWAIMIVVLLYSFARINESLIILYGHQNKNFGLSSGSYIFIMTIINLGSAIAAYPIGRLSDRISRYVILIYGMSLLILAALIMAFANSTIPFLIGIFLWGIQYGISQSLFMTIVGDSVPNDLRGTAFGFLNLIMAIGLVAGSTLDGYCIDIWGFSTTLILSAAVGALILIILCLFNNKFDTQKN